MTSPSPHTINSISNNSAELSASASAEAYLMGEQCPVDLAVPTARSSEKSVFGRLDTSYRTIDTKNTLSDTIVPRSPSKIRFTSVENIDKNTKKANIEAMKYYVSDKLHEIKESLASKKYNEWIHREYHNYLDQKNSVFELKTKELPLEVVLDYNNELMNYKNACLLDYAEKQFSGYIRALVSTNRYLLMENQETGAESLKKIITRYNDSYRDKIIKRMNWLMWEYGNENCCLLTLTVDPKKYDYDKFEMWKAISKKYKYFILKLKRYFKEHNRPFPSYLWGVESMYGRAENNYMSRGNPHLHVCFFNCKYVAPKKIIENLWSEGFVKINSTAKNEKIRYPIHYITKYITETFTNNSPDNTLVQSLVWLFNKHSFDHSAGLVLPLYPKGSGIWSLSGIVSIESGYCQVDEMIVIQEMMHSLFGGFKTPPPITRSGDLT